MKLKLKRKPRVKIEMGLGWNFYRDGVSSSFIDSWLKCREKAKLQFIDRLKRVSKGSSALRFGAFFHECLELWEISEQLNYNETMKSIVDFVLKEWRLNEGAMSNPGMHQAYESIAGKALSLLKGYRKFWDSDETEWIAIEEYFSIPFLGTKLVGIFDGVFIGKGGKVWLLETKTRSRIDIKLTAELLQFDLQTLLYLLALRSWLDSIPEYKGLPIAGVKYNLIRKPQLKLKKKEELHQYLERVDTDIEERPEFYYARVENACSYQSVLNWSMNTLAPIVKEIERWSMHKAAHYQNPASCQDKYGLCTFYAVCARNDKTQFIQKDRPYSHHPIAI